MLRAEKIETSQPLGMTKGRVAGAIASALVSVLLDPTDFPAGTLAWIDDWDGF